MVVSIKDIACRAGVSDAAVSMALRDNPRISLARREQIKQIAREMGYRPNLLARALVEGKTQTVGVLVTHLQLEVTGAKMLALDKLATEAGYRLSLSYSKGDFIRTLDRGRDLVSRGVDGMIVHECPSTPAGWDGDPMEFSVPTVFLGGSPPATVRRVSQDKSGDIHVAIDFLETLGHREIYFVAFQDFLSDSPQDGRLVGFRTKLQSRATASADTRIIDVGIGESISEDGHRVMDTAEVENRIGALLREHPDCTAILCSSDILALSVLLALGRLGVKVPDDISVVGFDNIAATAACSPPLTTIAQPVAKMARHTWQLLQQAIDGNSQDTQQIVVPGELVVRSSTGPVREHDLSMH